MEVMGSMTSRDFGIASFIALCMGIAFWNISSGVELLVTFIVGLVFTFVLITIFFAKKVILPDPMKFLPLFFLTLAVQFVHFAEEFMTGFATKFPALYGGQAYTDVTFVNINMISYVIFTLTALGVFVGRMKFFITPMLFFIVYGAMGNAIAHTTWSLYLGQYFPGLITGQIYWILGPILLKKLIGNWKVTLWILIPYLIALPVFLITFMR